MLQALQNGKEISYTDISNHIIALLVNHIKRGEAYVLEGFPQSQEDIDKINEELKKANVNKCFEPYYAITVQASDADILHKRQSTFVKSCHIRPTATRIPERRP